MISVLRCDSLAVLAHSKFYIFDYHPTIRDAVSHEGPSALQYYVQ